MDNNMIKHGLMAAFAAVGMLLATGCGYSKDIKEYPEPWQTLDPGKPLEKFPKIEILEQGGGNNRARGFGAIPPDSMVS